jgi:MoaA/NifB/PqqE/SkfB family radical SAM enzyme
MHLPKKIRNQLKKDDTTNEQYTKIRKQLQNLKSSNYDITNKCNLDCVGCLFFEGEDYNGHHDKTPLEEWETFFKKEKARGINFPYFAGAEPSLVPERLAIATKYFYRGVVFTNGAVKIDDKIPFTIHISVWDTPQKEEHIRGKSFFLKALENYKDDPRAVFIFTINSQNIMDIESIIHLCKEFNVKLSFSIYSPTQVYSKSVEDFSSSIVNYSPNKEDLLKIRHLLEHYRNKYKDTIIYSGAYNDWVTNPNGLYVIDPVTKIAINCEIMKQEYNIHYRTDLTSENSKCCSPNLECQNCRAYAMAHGTVIARYKEFLENFEEFEKWLEIADVWTKLFLRNN